MLGSCFNSYMCTGTLSDNNNNHTTGSTFSKTNINLRHPKIWKTIVRCFFFDRTHVPRQIPKRTSNVDSNVFSLAHGEQGCHGTQHGTRWSFFFHAAVVALLLHISLRGAVLVGKITDGPRTRFIAGQAKQYFGGRQSSIGLL